MENKYNGELILIRALPGSGKSTLAKIIAPINNVAADDYFDKFHGGEFKSECIKYSHQWCKDTCENMMSAYANTVCVHNTFTQPWEMEDYFKLAEKYNYRVHTIVVENRHGSGSVHNVPEKTISKMKDRFDIKL